tara:strand:- start:447 stop:1100 length:654 start_codon:yes stop_codon:yes gene_type:complete
MENCILAVPESLRLAEPIYWRGWLPVAFLNQKSVDKLKPHVDSNVAYCRLQSEVFFPEKVYIDWKELVADDDMLITSPNTIDQNNMVSIKFFACSFRAFSVLMGAFGSLEDSFARYQAGDYSVVPIGERYLHFWQNELVCESSILLLLKLCANLLFPLTLSLFEVDQIVWVMLFTFLKPQENSLMFCRVVVGLLICSPLGPAGILAIDTFRESWVCS